MRRLILITLSLASFLSSAVSTSAQRSVSGTVVSGQEPVVGAFVYIQGTQSGTVTDADGHFVIAVSDGEILCVECLGYKTCKLAVEKDRMDYLVDLEVDSQMLEDVVVVGYGSMKKSDLTGSVASVKMEALQDRNSNSIEGLLQGRAAGLQVLNTSQDPGAGSIIRIRGNSSLNGSNTPLIVVDGFPLGEAGNLSQINPADIASVEILKDASAAAIYGSRGANGVILVQTKRAEKGKTTVSVKHQTTVGHFTEPLNIWRDPLLMAQISNEELVNAGLSPTYIGAYTNGVYYPSLLEIEEGKWSNTDWSKIALRTPVVNNTAASVAYSTDKVSMNLSLNYFDDQGVYIKDSFNKTNVNFNSIYHLSKAVTVQASSILSFHGRNVNNTLEYGRNPLWPVYDSNGEYFLTSETDFGHPLVTTDNVKNQTDGKDFITSLAIEAELVKGLKLRSQLNYSYLTSIQDIYYASNTSQDAYDLKGQAQMNTWSSQDILSETYLTYSGVSGRHDYSVMAGHSFDTAVARGLYTTAYGFVNDSLQNEDMSAGDPEKNYISNSYSDSRMLSFYGRANYAYDDRYLLTVTMRADGSSKFGAHSKWGYFPSAAVSWKLHNEEWMKKNRVFEEFKIRASFGVSGNQGISPYQTLNRFGTEKYWSDGKWQTAVGPGYEVGREGANDRYVIWGGISNPELKWETTSQFNIGADFTFKGNGPRITVDYYEKYTTDLLREKFLPLSSGYDKMWVNDGSILNRGFEVTVDANIVNKRDFSLSGTMIFSLNRNTVTGLGNAVSSGLNIDPATGMQYEFCGSSLDTFSATPCIYAVGYPMYSFYGYRVDGVIQKDEDPGFMSNDGKDIPGELKYVDLNGDYAIDERDRCVIGDPNPDFTASLNLSVRWKGLDASIFLNGVYGNDVIYNGYTFDPRVKVKRWTIDNPTDKYPSLNSTRSYLFSDYFIQDGSYLRIQNLSLGYTFNLRSILSSIRVFADVDNLYTFTSFDGYNPEVGVDGIYWGGYPKLIRWSLGVDINF